MKAASLLAILALALPPAAAVAADDSPSQGKVKEALRARLAEDAGKTPPAAPAAKAEAAPAKGEPAPAPPAETGAAAAKAEATPSGAGKPAPTVLPKVEVKKGKYSERDRQLALDLQKQEQEIEREKKNLQVSEVDRALNDSKIAKPLAIFGGESAQYRKRVAAERVELLEAEKDIIEQIAIAQTAEEKKLLQKQLDELRAMRRQLDQAMR